MTDKKTSESKDGKGARAAKAVWNTADKATHLAKRVHNKVNVKAAGILLGSAASLVAKPCVQFYDGIREGFNKKAPPARD